MIVTAKFLIALLAASAFKFGHALDCSTCESETSWEECQSTASVVTCTTDEVNEFHAVASLGNPALTQGGPEDGFQCYALHVRSRDTGATSSRDRFSTGCTFAKTEFCQGWANSLVVVRCGVSEEGDVTFAGAGRMGGMGMVGVLVVGLFLSMI